MNRPRTCSIAVVVVVGAVATFPAEAAASPPNDDFADALLLEGPSGSVPGSNVSATDEPGEPEHWELAKGAVWYRWSAPFSQHVRFQTLANTFNSVLAVYTGTSVDALALVAANHLAPWPASWTSALSFRATAGTTYSVAVAGLGGDSGSFTLQWFPGAIIVGTPDRDRLRGTRGHDYIRAGRGADVVRGLRGDDRIDGGPGDDRLRGARGIDEIGGGGGSDTIYGGRGVDIIYGGPGSDDVYGRLGGDWIDGERGADHLYGGRGPDDLAGGAGPDHVYGGRGDDSVMGVMGGSSYQGEGGRDRLYGGPGDDWVGVCGQDEAPEGCSYGSLYGGPGADRLYGGEGTDRLYGGPGPDYLWAIDLVRGNDALYGGHGHDRASADRGDLVRGVP